MVFPGGARSPSPAEAQSSGPARGPAGDIVHGAKTYYRPRSGGSNFRPNKTPA